MSASAAKDIRAILRQVEFFILVPPPKSASSRCRAGLGIIPLIGFYSSEVGCARQKRLSTDT